MNFKEINEKASIIADRIKYDCDNLIQEHGTYKKIANGWGGYNTFLTLTPRRADKINEQQDKYKFEVIDGFYNKAIVITDNETRSNLLRSYETYVTEQIQIPNIENRYFIDTYSYSMTTSNHQSYFEDIYINPEWPQYQQNKQHPRGTRIGGSRQLRELSYETIINCVPYGITGHYTPYIIDKGVYCSTKENKIIYESSDKKGFSWYNLQGKEQYLQGFKGGA